MITWGKGDFNTTVKVGGILKIVFGSTKEQEEAIDQLLVYLRHSILPLYAAKEELTMYDSMGLLQFDSQRKLYNGTLKEAFQVMTALQTLTFIIENGKKYDAEEYLKYNDKFNFNVDLLNYYGLFFPFKFQHFKKTGSQPLHNNDKTHLSAQYYM